VFLIPRHFGFCYGVENAIEISYRALDENLGKNVYLLSQMIHNQEVNADLESRGIKFIMDTDGSHFVPWDSIGKDDVVIIPAFGTTLEIEKLLLDKGVDVQKYNTTCPIVRDMDDAIELSNYLLGSKTSAEFYETFAGKHSDGFSPELHLQRVGVVNQTTMLATETQGIADFFKQVMIQRYGEAEIKNHFADTRDTLCYATNDNQDSTYELLKQEADFAIVVGGYNSSNTSHIVELCERNFPTFFINSDREIKSKEEIQHFNYHRKELLTTFSFIPEKRPLKVVLTSGASCPDTVVDRVMLKLVSYFNGSKSVEEVLASF